MVSPNPNIFSNKNIPYDKTLYLAESNTKNSGVSWNFQTFPSELKTMDYATAEIRDFMEIDILEVLGEGFEETFNKLLPGDISFDPRPGVTGNVYDRAIDTASGVLPGSTDDFNKFFVDPKKSLIDQTFTGQLLKDNTKLREKEVARVSKIWLYEPNQQTTNYGIKYTEEDLGSSKKVAEVLTSVIDKGSVPGAIVKQAGVNVVSDIIKNITAANKSLSLDNIFGGEINLSKYINFKSRSIPTPLLEYTFEGIERRKFSFSWKLYPKSKEEALTVFHIIKTLKKNAHPSKLDNSPFYIKYPNIFKIRHLFINGQGQITENLYLNRMKPCVLDKITVNYTDSNGFLVFDQQMALFNDPDKEADIAAFAKAPIGIELSLDFTELELLFGEDFDINASERNPYQGGGY